MANPPLSSGLSAILREKEADILSAWLAEQTSSTGFQRHGLGKSDLAKEAKQFLSSLVDAASSGAIVSNIDAPGWSKVRDLLSDLSRSRATLGMSPTETAAFVLSLKNPLFNELQKALVSDPTNLVAEIVATTNLLDSLGLYTTEVFQKSREMVIQRQQQEMLELSTPVVSLYDQILALPLIGTLDSARTQVVMENLLNRIVETSAAIAIIDITGVPTVDTLVAQHLLKTVAAAKLMGADCIISGIRPQIAQTIIHLGVDLQGVATKATLADALSLALKRQNLAIGPAHVFVSNEQRGWAQNSLEQSGKR